MFRPKVVIFEKGVKEYEIGKKVYQQFINQEDIELIDEVASNRIKAQIEGDSPENLYRNGKQTLVVSIKKTGSFQTCKPSADYMLPLVSGCMGQCEYCYLHTQLGDKPFVRVNVNIDDILSKACKYMNENKDKITTFEGSATSDPLCVEPYTGALKTTIEFFSQQKNGGFRFVSKYNDVDNLLDISHNNKTEVRFSLNTERIRSEYEHFTASISARIEAAVKMIQAEYPVGFLIAPVFVYDGWEKDYTELLEELRNKLPEQIKHRLFFEVISHRFTPRAKNLINEIFPKSSPPMNEEERTFRYGQFGYGKYVYPKDSMQQIKDFFQMKLNHYFPDCDIKYII